jgi:hypothetical protein
MQGRLPAANCSDGFLRKSEVSLMKNSRFRFVGLILAVLLIAAATHAQVQVVNSLITTFAGGGAGCAGQTDSIGDGCPVADSGLRNPTGVALDSAGNLYIVDDFDNVIRKVSAATGEITTVAGSGTGCTGQTDSLGDGCPATSAQLSNPRAIAVDSAGNFYIADYGNQRIRKVTEATGIITTVGGNGTAGYLGDNNPATSAELDNPTGLAVNSSGTLLYIADSGNNVVRMVNLTSGTITTVAGNGFGSGTTGGGYTGDTGPATNAEMWNPSGVALDSSGNLYIADTYNSAIREVNASTQKIITGATAVWPPLRTCTIPTTSRLIRPATCTLPTLTIASFGKSTPLPALSRRWLVILSQRDWEWGRLAETMVRPLWQT